MIDEATLRKKAREAIEARKLPNCPPAHTWAGNGLGTCCALCGIPVKRDEIGYDLEFTTDSTTTGSAEYHVHVRCFRSWELELHASETTSSPHVSAQNTGPPIPPTSVVPALTSAAPVVQEALALRAVADHGTIGDLEHCTYKCEST